jgi:hypothetical protein
VRPEGLGKFKNSPHRESNPRPSGLQHSDANYMSDINIATVRTEIVLVELQLAGETEAIADIALLCPPQIPHYLGWRLPAPSYGSLV